MAEAPGVVVDDPFAGGGRTRDVALDVGHVRGADRGPDDHLGRAGDRQPAQRPEWREAVGTGSETPRTRVA